MLFGIQLAISVLSWMVLARGAVLGVMSFFQPVDEHLYLVSTAALLAAVLLIVAVGVIALMKVVNKTAFEEKKSTWKVAIVGGVCGIVVFGLFMGIVFFFKDKGPVIELPWLASLLTGFVLLLVSQWMPVKMRGAS